MASVAAARGYAEIRVLERAGLAHATPGPSTCGRPVRAFTERPLYVVSLVSSMASLDLTTPEIGARRSLSRVQAPRSVSWTSFKFSFTCSGPLKAHEGRGYACAGQHLSRPRPRNPIPRTCSSRGENRLLGAGQWAAKAGPRSQGPEAKPSSRTNATYLSLTRALLSTSRVRISSPR